MKNTFKFANIARLPLPADNVAIATHRLEAGTMVNYGDQKLRLSHTVLEGHRFAVQPIQSGETLLSWELPFGVATEDIPVGGYVINADTISTLREYNVELELPPEANFSDWSVPFHLDESTFLPARQVSLVEEAGNFWGYRRPGERGVGTRNYILLLGINSHTAGFVEQLAARLKGKCGDANIDGIVAVSHTEGGIEGANNLEILLRTLAGFIVHPNTAAVLVADYASDPLSNGMLRAFMRQNRYPLDAVPHHFLSLSHGFEQGLAQGEMTIQGWLRTVSTTQRTAEPLSHLKIALQCGGSDTFSGISGNPLASWVAREIIRHGGAANLGETAELTGGEPYVLQRVRDIDTGERFLDAITRLRERASWHGDTIEGNVTGGNKYRGLYNITLKSIGAARKRHPDVRLDHAIEYGQLMTEPGFYFMDTPGNDLESIAGQVAAGCNMILFVTGNGSITNFPFVPTIKIVTTTGRYELLSQDMDINAGLYLDGTPMETLGEEAVSLTMQVVSGRRTVGEGAGHSQVQIWRNWRQTESRHPPETHIPLQRDGVGLAHSENVDIPIRRTHLSAIHTPNGFAGEQVGLVLPVSLCAAQVACLIANKLNSEEVGKQAGLSRFVALPHTEGCGASRNSEPLLVQALLGYITHPSVRYCLLLEHGCEKTHNNLMWRAAESFGINPKKLGWASVQQDGGIQKVIQKVVMWFEEQLSGVSPLSTEAVGLDALSLGLAATGRTPPQMIPQIARLAGDLIGGGGTLILPENSDILDVPAFLEILLSGDSSPQKPTLAYAQKPTTAGLHIMEMPTTHWSEMLTGLGAAGVGVILAHVGQHPMPGHPLLPVLQVSAAGLVSAHYSADLDLSLEGEPANWPGQILDLVIDAFSHRYVPQSTKQGNLHFQMTRGSFGVSL
jgi:altronate dehydratase